MKKVNDKELLDMYEKFVRFSEIKMEELKTALISKKFKPQKIMEQIVKLYKQNYKEVEKANKIRERYGESSEQLDKQMSKVRELRHKVIDLRKTFFIDNYIWGFCFADLSECDLSKIDIKDLMRVTFSTNTLWPKKDKLPIGFNPKKIIEKAKTFKGLGVENLHKQGITGSGVKVAYIDKGFTTEHIEFADRKIEYIDVGKNPRLDFHGSSVASKLVGKNLGMAPDVDLLFYNVECEADLSKIDSKQIKNKYFCESLINEFKALNDIIKRVKNGEDIIAVGISASIPHHFMISFEEGKEKDKYTKKYQTICKTLNKLGVTLFDSETFWESGFSYAYKIDPLLNNNDYDNYCIRLQYNGYCVIDAAKCVPLVYTKEGYQYENEGGCASWSIPQVLGLFCLAKQVDKTLSFDEFVEITKKTSRKPNANNTILLNAEAMIKEVDKRKNK